MCPPPRAPRLPRRRGGRLLLAAAAAVLAGCGPPPQPAEPPAPLPNPTGGTVSTPPTFPGQPPGTVPGFPTGISDQFAVDCGGQPSGGQLLALLVAEDLLDDSTDAEFVTGPLCAGDWQYAVVSVADLDPLQVVSSGEPDNLELVAAGTDICTPEVRIQAPPGIRSAAACGA